MLEILKPLNIALMQMIPDRLYKYRSCEDKHISAFENGRNDNARILLWYFAHGMTVDHLIEGGVKHGTEI